MISAESLYGALISMIDAADGDIFLSVFGGPNCNVQPGAFEELESLVPEIRKMIEGYNYSKSPAFRKSCSGKSGSYIAMKSKFEGDGQRKRTRKEELLCALRDLRNSDHAYQLVPFSGHSLLDNIQKYLNHYGAKA